MTKVATTSSCRLSTCGKWRAALSWRVQQNPKFDTQWPGLAVCFHLDQPLEPGAYRVILVKLGWSGHTECQGQTSSPHPPYSSLIERGSEEALHGNTTLPKICIHICSHSRRAKEYASLDFKIKGSMNFCINRQGKDFLLWLQSWVSCAAKDLRMKTELNCYIL